jgi:hypothetical protein
MKLKNKKADELFAEQIIFWVLNAFFFIGMLLFIVRVSSGSALLEETYAKKIGLSIDLMRPGTELRVDLKPLYDKAIANKYNEKVVVPDILNNKITVKVQKGKGYEFRYFTNIKDLKYDENSKVLFIKN